jgi:hypothetical protein
MHVLRVQLLLHAFVKVMFDNANPGLNPRAQHMVVVAYVLMQEYAAPCGSGQPYGYKQFT